MRIVTNGVEYPCSGYRAMGDTARFVLTDTVPEVLGDTVILLTESRMELAVLTVAEWLRWYVSGSTLVLTNLPEPEPEDPQEQPPTELEQLRADVDFIAAMVGVEL